MTKEELLAMFENKKVQNTSYLVAFFLVFTFFVYFAIRPNVITGFTLQEELEELRDIYADYQQAVKLVITYQDRLQKLRDRYDLLEEAVPSSPQTYDVIQDLRSVIQTVDLNTQAISISEINLKQINKPENGEQEFVLQPFDTFEVDLTVSATLSSISSFLDQLFSQRRLKTTNTVSIVRTSETIENNELQYRIIFEIQVYSL